MPLFRVFGNLKRWGKLQLIMTKLPRLTDQRDMPRRVELCQEALALVDRESRPKLWAVLQVQLGYSLQQNPLGARAENLEQAIHHYQQALQILTRQSPLFGPFGWARIQNNLAGIYLYRIRGERAENLEQAIFHFEQALEVYTRQAYPETWAQIMGNLAGAYRERIRGERADNIEQAIDYCQQALKVCTRQTLIIVWAGVQNTLGLAYSDRIRGERASNLEQAIAHFQQARTAFSSGWAATTSNLAEAYSNRIRGKRADNLELAIHYYQQALTVYTRQTFPQEWATTQNNLALAYHKRIRKKRADNIEQAIDYYKQTLEVLTHEAFPFKWALTHNNLAGAYRERIRGERADNIEQAIRHHQQALTVYTRQAAPFEWAQTQSNLALAYHQRIRGEHADNLEQAIRYYEQTLEVSTYSAFPEKWAQTMNNLAGAYSNRIREERAQNIEQAIHYYEQTLKVYTQETFPYPWARTQNNLAGAYWRRIQGERADNLEQVIDYCQQALQVWTHEAFPEEWATTQSNLARAYRDRICGERAPNNKQAIRHYRQALLVRTPQSFPQDCSETAYWLGRLLYDEGRFAEARKALGIVHEAIEALRGEVLRDAGKRALAEENADLYARLVFCCLHDANADETPAFEYAVAGKGRAFVDMLATARFDLSAAGTDDRAFAADWQKYRQLQQQIDALQIRLTSDRALHAPESHDTAWAESRATWIERWHQLQADEREHWEEMTFKYPKLTATQQVPALEVTQARTLAAQLSATLVEYYHHAEGWCAFVVTSDEVRHVPLDEVNDEFLQDMLLEWLGQVEHPIFHNEPSYLALDEWYEVLITPIKPYLPPKGKVVLAPAGVLHLIPLNIGRNPDTLAYLCDEYTISFVPSLAALRMAHLEAKKAAKETPATALQNLLTVAYPGESGSQSYLEDAIPEAEAIATHFPNVTALHADAATPQAVIRSASGQNVVHFSCHGSFNFELPEQSGFVLSDGYLTVQRIITELRLSGARLATLSACLTHRAALNAGEEHVGLVQAIMTAGAQSVVASLWRVPQEPTRALFEHFYRAVANGEPPANALKQAMRHVRQQPGWEHPYYWAAFQVSGLGFSRNL